MLKLMKRHSDKAGLPPGSLVFLGEKRVEEVTVTVIDYDEGGVREQTVTTPEECRRYVEQETVTWINMTGLNDTKLLAKFGEAFHIHPLVLEEILNTGQRPRFEDHGESIFCVMKMLYRGKTDGEMVSEQVSLIVRFNSRVKTMHSIHICCEVKKGFG